MRHAASYRANKKHEAKRFAPWKMLRAERMLMGETRRQADKRRLSHLGSFKVGES